MLRGTRHRLGGVRMELSAADDRDPPCGGGGHGRTRRSVARHLHAAVPAEAAAAAGDRSGRRHRSGAADRRARPHGRAVRSVSARGTVRFPGVDSRTRPDRREVAAHRRHHVEPHARDPRRDQAPLSLPLGRLSRCDARAVHSAPQVSARAGDAARARSSRSRSACARWTCSRHRASPKRWTGRRRC